MRVRCEHGVEFWRPCQACDDRDAVKRMVSELDAERAPREKAEQEATKLRDAMENKS